MTITAAGLAVIGLTGGGATRPQHASLAALIAVEGAIFATGAAPVRIATRRLVLRRAEGLRPGAAAGALFGVSTVALRYLTQAPTGPLFGSVSPWALTALVAGAISFYASARSLQIGKASRSSPSPPPPRPRRHHRLDDDMSVLKRGGHGREPRRRLPRTAREAFSPTSRRRRCPPTPSRPATPPR